MIQKNTIAVSLANSIDYVVNVSSDFLQEAADRLAIHLEDLFDPPSIENEKMLIQTFLYFMVHQEGGERFIDNPHVLRIIAQHYPYTITFGGTALRAALLLASLEIPTFLHLAFDSEDYNALDPLIERFCNPASPPGTFHPILQFQRGLSVVIDGECFTAPEPNRMILNNNPALEALVLDPVFFARLGECKALLLSGLNATHSFSTLSERLAALKTYIEPHRDELWVVYEDGHFHAPDFRAAVIWELGPLVDFYSMNEDEWQTLLKKRIDLHDEIAIISSLNETQELLPHSVIIIHTKYWVMISGENAPLFKEALTTARDMATREMLQLGPWEPLPFEFNPLPSCMHNDAVFGLPTYDIPHPTVASVGLGDAFIGGFLSQLPQKRSRT